MLGYSDVCSRFINIYSHPDLLKAFYFSNYKTIKLDMVYTNTRRAASLKFLPTRYYRYQKTIVADSDFHSLVKTPKEEEEKKIPAPNLSSLTALFIMQKRKCISALLFLLRCIEVMFAGPCSALCPRSALCYYSGGMQGLR